jgi:hypothetical protein
MVDTPERFLVVIGTGAQYSCLWWQTLLLLQNVQVYCTGLLYWSAVLICCTDFLYRSAVQISCTDQLYWSAVLSLVPRPPSPHRTIGDETMLYWSAVLICCTDFLYRSAVQISCTDQLYWSAVLSLVPRPPSPHRTIGDETTAVLICCTDLLYWSAVLICCTDLLYWSVVLYLECPPPPPIGHSTYLFSPLLIFIHCMFVCFASM